MCSMSWASASCAEATRAACPGGAFAARCWRRIFLTWLALSLLPKVFPLLGVLVRLRRRGFQILFAIRVRLDIGHVASPCWLREMKQLRKRAFLRLSYTIMLSDFRELRGHPSPQTGRIGDRLRTWSEARARPQYPSSTSQ